MTLPSMAASAIECEIKTPVQINITPKSKKIRYNFSQSLEEIQASNTHTHSHSSPYSFSQDFIRQGYMKAEMKMEPVVKTGGLTYSTQGKTCLWYESIDINIEIDPQIIIAKEVYEDSCMKKAVLEHEMKHIKIDRQLANQYSKRIARKIYQELSSENAFVHGPFPSSRKGEVTKEMQNRIFKIAQREYKELEKDRHEKQAHIDNADEYQRVSNQCPNYKNALHEAVKPVASDYYRRRSGPLFSVGTIIKKSL